MDEWFCVYRHNRLLFFWASVIASVLSGVFFCFALVNVLSANDPVDIAWGKIDSIFFGFLSLFYLGFAFFFLASMKRAGNVDGKSYTGTLVSSHYNGLLGLSFAVLDLTEGRRQELATPSGYQIMCFVMVGRIVTFPVSKNGYAIIDKVEKKDCQYFSK